MKYRSKPEKRLHETILKDWEYESTKLFYKLPYTPDWTNTTAPYEEGVTPEKKYYLEYKGYLRRGDSRKYRAVKDGLATHEELIFIFDNPNKKMVGAKKLTHGQWAEKYGFRYCCEDTLPSLLRDLKEEV